MKRLKIVMISPTFSISTDCIETISTGRNYIKVATTRGIEWKCAFSSYEEVLSNFKRIQKSIHGSALVDEVWPNS